MSNLTARDIMTGDVKTIRDQATLKEAAELLTNEDIGGAPVVDYSGALVGIISETDLMDQKKRRSVLPRMALFGLWKVPEALVEESYREGMLLRVRDVMSHNPVTVSDDTPVRELAEMMLQKKINRVPVVRNGEVVGIVTRQDVLRGMLHSEG